MEIWLHHLFKKGHVAERTRNEEEASVSLQQFEAAAGFGGLGLNVGKTEVMD